MTIGMGFRLAYRHVALLPLLYVSYKVSRFRCLRGFQRQSWLWVLAWRKQWLMGIYGTATDTDP